MSNQSVQRILHLYGATSQAETLNFVRTQCVIGEDELEKIMSEWRDASSRFAEISGKELFFPETIQVKEIPSEFLGELESIGGDPLFRNAFSMVPTTFKMVELEKLVAGQRFVNLDYAERLESMIPENPDMKFLIDFCLRRAPQPRPPAELQLGPNVYSYKSESTDFRFIGGYPKKLSPDDIAYSLGGGQPVAALILFVGYGTSTCNVFQVDSRFILNNGFHRLFALRKKGVEEAPVAVQSINNWNLELPSSLMGLPTSYLVTTPRPSILRDFLDKRISRELLMKARDRSVQIQWNVNQLDIPK